MPNTNSKKLILIVEDDEDIQSIYKEMISDQFDVELDQQYDGKQGLDAVNKRRPDLVILDILMPVMNGEEFLKEFRYTLKIKDVPIIVCSVNQALAQKMLSQGDVEAVLPKLFMEKDLVVLITKLLAVTPKKIS